MSIKKIISVLTGIIISLAFLYLAFKEVDFRDLMDYIGKINFLYIIPCVLLVLLGFFARALRWKILLSGRVGTIKAFNIMMTGFMLNCIMPLRAGEIARPVLISRNSEVGFPEALSSVAVERVFDLAILLLLFACFTPFIDISPELSYQYQNYILNRDLLLNSFYAMSAIGFVLSMGLFFVAWEKTRKIILSVINLAEILINRLPVKLSRLIIKYAIAPLRLFINGLAAGTSSIKTPLNLAMVFILSFLAWFLQAVSYYILIKGSPGIDLGFAEVTFVLIIVSFVIALPSVPGFWGLWEAGGVFAMSVFQVAKTEAAGFNLVNHAVQMFPVIITGIICAWITGFSMKKIREEKD